MIYLTYKLQKPNLVVSINDDKYDERYQTYYVHLKVKNASRGYLGGGAAINCRCKLTLQGRNYITKWATRPNPLRREILPGAVVNPVVNVPDPLYLDQAKYEYLRPSDEKLLDVAVRFRGSSDCYIHEPENFEDLNYKPEKNRLGVGEYPFRI